MRFLSDQRRVPKRPKRVLKMVKKGTSDCVGGVRLLLGNYARVSCLSPLPPFLSAAQPTDQGEERVVLVVVVVVVVVVGGFGGTVFRSPMYNQNGCIQRKLFLKMGASRENLKFLKMGVS